MSAGLANRRGAEFSARIFSTNFQHADSQCTNFNSNNLRVLSPLVYNIYSVVPTHSFLTQALVFLFQVSRLFRAEKLCKYHPTSRSSAGRTDGRGRTDEVAAWQALFRVFVRSLGLECGLPPPPPPPPPFALLATCSVQRVVSCARLGVRVGSASEHVHRWCHSTPN